jgi:hypothetical protein
MKVGLVQERENFILPNDAYPVLQNAFVWRERIKRKQGYQLLGRLQRILTTQSLGNSVTGVWTFSLYSTLVPPITGQPNADLVPGSVLLIIGAITFTDNGNGTLTGSVGGNSGTVNYATGAFVITHTAGIAASTISFNYFPNLPVMGIQIRQLNNINNEETIFWDTVYAYHFVGTSFQEFLPGTVWTGTDANFFWTTNYWVGDGNFRIFWETNFSGTLGDPIRYTNGQSGTNWINFAPQIDNVGNRLQQCLSMLPFRSRLVTFNTLEGMTLATSVSFPQRIRWAAIGNPFSDISAIVTTVNANAWRDDIRGQGGFLDIPTSENIVAIGFVRDNLVVFCERSTWQLRYTGRSIAPFQIEKINSELGTESTFSAIQFDTSLVGIGDKGIVECDSYKSNRIDIKIPDLVFQFNNENNGPQRVQGIRDFVQRLAFWIYPFVPDDEQSSTYPNRRLVYNYENDSWAIFNDSLTALGTYQSLFSRTWEDTPFPWNTQNYPWINRPALIPSILGGNQQGFVEYLDQQVNNDISLTINNIIGNTTTSTQIKSVNHNMEDGFVIKITNINAADPFVGLNNQIFGITIVDKDNFLLWIYNPNNGLFTIPQVNPPGTYIGGGTIAIREGFSVVSKKFNSLDQGQNIQIGYIDILMDTTDFGAITLNIYLDYNDSQPSNTPPQNENPDTLLPDTFFNSIVPTSLTTFDNSGTSKTWQRVYCATNSQFLTVEWTLSNAQLIGIEQESNVQIDAQIVWMRNGGRLGF